MLDRLATRPIFLGRARPSGVACYNLTTLHSPVINAFNTVAFILRMTIAVKTLLESRRNISLDRIVEVV